MRDKWLLWGALALLAYWWWAKHATTPKTAASTDSTGMGFRPVNQIPVQKFYSGGAT